MNVFPKFSYRNGNTNFVSTEQLDLKSDEIVFCTEDNIKESLHELSEELSSFGIAPVTPANDDDPQSAESLKQLSVKLINSTWNFTQKHRLFMRLHEKTNLSNHKTNSNNIYLQNQVKRLKEDLQKKEQMLLEVKAKGNRFKENLENASRDLKHEKEETQKLRKQAQSKDVQHEHEVKRILKVNLKLQEQLQKSAGTFVPRDKILQKAQANHGKELATYKATVCRLEENNSQLLQEINNLVQQIDDLKETVALYKDAINLHMEATGEWDDVNET